MTSLPLHVQFRSFVDDDAKYERFVHACIRSRSGRGRLRHWQELLWSNFVDEVPGFTGMPVDDILDHFYFCPLHQNPLTEMAVHIPADLIVTTVGSSDPNTPYGFRHPFAVPHSSETHEIRLDTCPKCLALADRNRENPSG
ncbi:hypothetical protein EC9_26880 [Rosistilla ulvae]|uniref:Uncharacterized protein n=1 Tax=Rosistilla ulvae TaxID=1930277 RepID=A0A517M0U2_9BACT|nr:hypothetical protein [Rosistilla ulvae]QDS88497.1 hypothetical protein EC9_26880 [Rosistilla ulvae]